MIIDFTESVLQNLQSGGTNRACIVNEEEYTYAALASITGSIQGKMHRTGSQVVGVITQNSVYTYACLFATWLTGKAYVPINASYPIDRIRIILAEAEINTIFYAEETEEIEKLKANLPGVQFLLASSFEPANLFNTYPSSEKTAYILFTSGTTGKPKGVPITYGNLASFLEGVHAMGYTLTAEDRFLQMFELTFDLSVVSFLLPISIGASFYTLPSGMIRTLGLYHVMDFYEITFSLMVPSAIHLLAPYLEDVELPSLKYSQFCGEALKLDILSKWAQCIPNARIDNVYGPTEATIYCTYQTLPNHNLESKSMNGVMGIGSAMKNVQTALFIENKKVTTANTHGELCLSGGQITPGYLNNPAQNEKAFFLDGQTKYYRTGDLVVFDENDALYYLGRADDQVKIQGFRIELAEIELATAKVLPGYTSVAVGFQDTGGNWMLALFIQNLAADPAVIRGEIARIIPEYMVPHSVHSLVEFPLNSNGKTDKNMLREMARKTS